MKERVVEAHSLGSLCGAAIFDLGPINSDSRTKYGLPSGHAYTLTGSEEDQVEVRNPWGEKTEWVGQTSAPDGEFWMAWDQFMTHFHQVYTVQYCIYTNTMHVVSVPPALYDGKCMQKSNLTTTKYLK